MSTLTIEIGWAELTQPKRIPLVCDKAPDSKFFIRGKTGYEPMVALVDRFPTNEMPFDLLSILHCAGLQMIRSRWNLEFDRSILAAGPLYLILQKAADRLMFHQMYGDFTSSYSHAIGVAMAIMVTSVAYGIRFDNFEAIPMKGKRGQKVMDFMIEAPDKLILMEAKGMTSNSLTSMRNDIYEKKLVPFPRDSYKKATTSLPIISLGLITKIGGEVKSPDSFVEVVDPPLNNESVSQEELVLIGEAARYMHYAKLCLFAGLVDFANVLTMYAHDKFTSVGSMWERYMHPSLNYPTIMEAKDKLKKQLLNRPSYKEDGSNFVGVKWRLIGGSDEIWISQGVDLDRILMLIEERVFPTCTPLELASQHRFPTNQHEGISSILPSGSFFRVGRRPIEEFKVMNTISNAPYSDHNNG